VIAACWAATAAVSVLYGAVLAASTDAARAAAPLFLAVAFAAWLILSIHDWRHR
jgi:hypothetical protein